MDRQQIMLAFDRLLREHTCSMSPEEQQFALRNIQFWPGWVFASPDRKRALAKLILLLPWSYTHVEKAIAYWLTCPQRGNPEWIAQSVALRNLQYASGYHAQLREQKRQPDMDYLAQFYVFALVMLTINDIILAGQPAMPEL